MGVLTALPNAMLKHARILPTLLTLTLALPTIVACDVNVENDDDDDSAATDGPDDDDSGDSDDSNGSGNDSNDSDDSDGSGNDSNGSGNDSDGSGNDTNDSDDSGGSSSGGASDSDDTNGSGDGDGPNSGLWVYADSGASSSSCDFLEDSGQGVGDFAVENHGDGSFTVTPSDDTDPFKCAVDADGVFDCDERFVESVDGGNFDVMMDVIVRIDGTTQAASMDGEQHGRVECEGSDCTAAEAFLGTSFPCEFVIPFTAQQQ